MHCKSGIPVRALALSTSLCLLLSPIAAIAQSQPGSPQASSQSPLLTQGASSDTSSTQDPPAPQPPFPGLTNPQPSTTLEQLYPPPPVAPSYSAETGDPALSGGALDRARGVSLGQIPTSELLPIGKGRLPPIRLEASFTEVLSLKDTLQYAIRNSLPIRISDANYDSQRYLFYSSLGSFLPDFTLTYRGQRIDNPGNSPVNKIFTDSATIRYPVFQGGGVFFGALAQRNRSRAAKSQLNVSVNDTLLEVYRRYNELLLNLVLLQIRVKSVELSRAQLELNQELKDAGVGTNFAIYQSRTQLALDKQALLTQQVTVRQSALQLALAMNASVAMNIYPDVVRVTEAKIADQTWDINQLVAVAARRRPELKQFEYLRRAANRDIQVAASPLYPTFQFFTSTTNSQSSGGGGGGRGGGGNSSASNLGGSTVIIPTGSGGGGIGISGSGGRSYSAGFDLSWNLTSMGVPNAFNTMAARAQARQALLQSNQQLITVLQQIRSSYLNMLTAEAQVDVAGEAVVSAGEQLRLANLRLRYGQGINLELIQAQRDYINSLTTQAQAIVAYNISQAQLLRDTGMISIDTLVAQRPPRISLSGNVSSN